MRAPLLSVAVCLSLGLAVQAEVPNLSPGQSGDPGAAAQVILAQRTYAAAVQGGDPALLITAIRLARGVVLRSPAGWTRTTRGDPTPDAPDGAAAAPDPAGPQAIAIAQGLAGDDPDLQDLVYDLDAQLPHGRRPTVTNATATLDGGQVDSWRMVLAGETAAELGLIGDGDTRLGLTVADDSGTLVCATAASIAPALCRFTPARNGFFTVEVRNAGSARNSYRLVGN